MTHITLFGRYIGTACEPHLHTIARMVAYSATEAGDG